MSGRALFRLLLAAALALSAGAASADCAISILHTNDFHARFEPNSEYAPPAPPKTTTPASASAERHAWRP